MAVYFVGRLTVTDPSWIREYTSKVPAMIESHGGRYITQGAEPTRIEGDLALPNAVVIIEFPSREAAMAWYESEEYAPMRDLRQSGSTLDFLLVDGRP